jgi:hypothetical protein
MKKTLLISVLMLFACASVLYSNKNLCGTRDQ